MKKTLARVQFKKHFGQANHHLVTALVALDVLAKSNIAEAPKELRTTWSPKNKNASVARSRNFVLQSFLGWAVDSIDMYLGLLNRKPNFIHDQTLESKLNGAGRSVSKKVAIYSDHYKIMDTTRALIDVLITWRNNVFHELADNQLRSDTRTILTANPTDIASRYRGLIIDDLGNKAEKGSSLTFKETASLINASHYFVQEIDEKILNVFDAKLFCKEAVQDALNDKEQKTGFRAKYSGLTDKQRHRFLKNWFMNKYAFGEIDTSIIDACLHLKKVSNVD